MTAEPHSRYEFGRFRLEPGRQLLLHDGRPLRLKPKVFDLLLLLVQNRDRLLPKRELMDRLWAQQFVEESNLTQSVYELRQALEVEPGAAAYVETVPRRGYRFVAPVRVVREAGNERESVHSVRSLAVLPFQPLVEADRDPSLELGIADSLITALGCIGGVTVRSTSAIRRYEDPRQDCLAAGKELLVDAVLEGTIQRAGERLRVTARLARVSDGATLWGEAFDEPFTGIFEIEDAIRDRVVGTLALELPGRSDESVRERPTPDLETYELFLKCRHHWHKWTPEDWRRSIAYGREAIARDAGHAPSHAWTAASYCCLGIAGVMPPHDAFEKASELVIRALELDDTLSVAHEVLGAIELFYRWRWELAERALLRALALNASDAGARDLRALHHVVTGQLEEAIQEVKRARDTDPLSLLMNTDVAYVHYYARQYAAAEEQFRRTLELDTWFAHARLGLGYVLLAQDRNDAAVAEMESAVAHSGRGRETSADLGYALARAGDRSGAEAIRDGLIARSRESFVDPYAVALVQVGLDEPDAAFTWLDAAFEARSRELIYLRANPVFDPLRSDPRLPALLARVGIADSPAFPSSRSSSGA